MTGFKVNFKLQDSDLSAEFHAAEILEENGYRACIVGDAATVVYGSDLLVSDIYLAIADEQLQDGLATLISQGFIEEPQTNERFKDSNSTKDSGIGWPGYRLTLQPPRSDGAGVFLVPASFWHLDRGREHHFSSTLVYPESSCRFPELLVYFDALVDVLTERIPDEHYNASITLYFQYQYFTMAQLLPPQLYPFLPAENQFFLEFFPQMTGCRKAKICQLRQKIRDGSISPDAARALVPQRDLKVAALKRKRAAMAAMAAN